MESIWLLTKKNLQLLLRSRGSALIVVFAPLLLILILALTYNTQGNYAVNIGVYAPVFTPGAESIISLLQAQNYTLIRYEGSIEGCFDDVKGGYAHACLSLPESLNPEGNVQKEIKIYVDNSRTQLVYVLKDVLSSAVDIKSEEIGAAQSGDVLSRLTSLKTSIEQRKAELGSIKEKSSSATASTDATKSVLQSIDLTAPATPYDKSVLDVAAARLNVTRDLLNATIGQLNLSNISDADRAVLAEHLENVSSSIEFLGSIIENTDGTSLPGLVGVLEGDLAASKAKLENAASQVSSSSTSLNAASVSIKETLSALDSLNSNLDEAIKIVQEQKITDPKALSTPIVTSTETISAQDTYLSYLFPAILILVVMFGSLLLGTTLVMIEKNSPAFLRNYFVPLPKIYFILATYLTNLILIVVQILIIMLIAAIFLSNQAKSFPAVALVLFLVASIFTFLGMIIGYILTSEETAVLGSISVGTILLAISGVIMPIEVTSKALQGIISLSPVVIAERVIRQLFIFGSTYAEVTMDIAVLAGYTILLFLLILVLETVLHRHLVERFSRNHSKVSARNKPKPAKSEF